MSSNADSPMQLSDTLRSNEQIHLSKLHWGGELKQAILRRSLRGADSVPFGKVTNTGWPHLVKQGLLGRAAPRPSARCPVTAAPEWGTGISPLVWPRRRWEKGWGVDSCSNPRSPAITPSSEPRKRALGPES